MNLHIFQISIKYTTVSNLSHQFILELKIQNLVAKEHIV
jgi:hypothetical protein